MKKPSRVTLAAALLTMALSSWGLANGLNYDPTDDLINAFSSSCRIGRYTATGLTQASSLASIVKTMESDSSCDSIRSALSNFIDSQNQMATLLASSQATWNQNRNEQELNDLLSAYTAETDPNVQLALASDLAALKVQTIQGAREAQWQQRLSVYNGMSNFARYGDSLFSALNSGTQCLQKRSGLALQILGQALAMSSSFMSYPMSPAAFAAGTALNALVSYLHYHHYQKLLKDISAARMTVALGCAMESMSRSYCEARDAQNLIDAYENFSDRNRISSEWRGFTLYNRDMQAYVTWAQRLTAGAKATNKAQARVKGDAELLDAGYRYALIRLPAIIGEARLKIRALPAQDPQIVRNIIRGAIDELVSATNQNVDVSSGGNQYYGGNRLMSRDSPFYQLFLADPNCGPKIYFYTGKFGQYTPPGGVVYGDSGCGMPPYPDTAVPGIDTLEEWAKSLLVAARDSVANQVRLYRENDANGVLSEFEQSRSGLASPHDVLLQVVEYISGLQKKYGSLIPQETSDAMTDTIERLTEALKIHASDQKKLDKVSHIAEVVAPLQDTLYISARLRLIVNWELEEKIKDGSISQDIALILHLSVIDNVKPLEELQVVDIPYLKTSEIPRGQFLANNNLKELEHIFAANIDKSFEMLSKGNSSSASYSKTLDVLCMQALSLPSAPKISSTDLYRYCHGRRLSVVEGLQTVSLEFDKMIGKPFDNRACSYYDFNRKARLASLQAERKIKPLQ